jgi:PBP1b-binding outer membrane lipoprotein LpoB
MRLTSLAAVALLAMGCATKTKRTTYVDPDAYGAVEGTGIEARDIRAVADQMARELLGSPAVQGFEGAPRIALLKVKNRSRFLVDQDILTTLITDKLVSNAGGSVAMLDRALVEEIQAERDAKRAGAVDAQGFKAMAGADFFLTGEVRGLSASTDEAQSDYVLIRFQLTDAESGIVSWSSSYEMKKEGSWGVMYQ